MFAKILIPALLGGPYLFPALAQAPAPALPPKLALRYSVEWRLITAGWARLDYDAQNTARVHLESQGLVSKLYRVNDNYLAVLDAAMCTSTVSMQAEEGSRKRETLITFDKERKRIRYLEKDLVKNQVMLDKAMVSGGCVNDVIGGLMRLRTLRLEPGQTLSLPLSDGKKLATVKVDCEAKEDLKTPAGAFNTTRYLVEVFDGVLYNRKGTLQVWISNDERRWPVQIRARLPFYIGSITLQLEKEQKP
ncbi:MAG: DUF3108 domain-containing protein [Bryobacteraceae bacterium]|nr:DUF3108 domain-containing protein [Bryobacteraceae bacterium]